MMVKISAEKNVLPSQHVRRGGGVAHVYETLRNEIIELKLAPGSPLTPAPRARAAPRAMGQTGDSVLAGLPCRLYAKCGLMGPVAG